MRRIWLLAAAVVALALAAPTQAPAETEKPPVVIFLHGGGFLFQDAGRMPVATELAGELGYEVAYLDYPLFDLPGAIAAAERYAQRLTEDGRTVVAYGESAGGTLAALLAQKGLVDAAATYSPVPDMREFPEHTSDPDAYVDYIQADSRDLRRASPALFTSPVPILAMRAAQDAPFLARGMRRWERRDAQVQVIRVPGLHSGSYQPATYGRNATLALRWLLHVAG